ncbi:hypothetical protein PBAL39_17734 [Pedobacter sp. BAL39]|uniref:GIN domain-containing protein n=1 Tax=Pedobacter sp. BAL39 TaxID=391596 RepID=UPI0001559CE3|nr:DUF2807 domain-containing protein [Pedobacter sp. BAL39]EDM36739.1 hypothetical protein PBAL39_17734 [Pedobacter sp. BAL39]
MKTAIKKLIASTFVAAAILTTTAGSFAQSKIKMEKGPLQPFNKVIVTGNANVVLVQSEKENIRIHDYSDREQIKISQKGYNLYIDSKNNDPAVIYVYVKDLHRIDASSNAKVKTQGNFNLNVLQIFLQDNAKADVNANVASLYTNMKNKSNLKLAGSSKHHTLIKTDVIKLKMSDFAALKTDSTTVAETQNIAAITSVSK